VTDALMPGASVGVPAIRTPDQRVRVFVSSTIRELAAERAVAGKTITRMRLTPTMFETGARPHPPRELYRAYLAQSEVFVGIYWQQYGWVAPGEEVSGLEDEYRLAGVMPKLIYVKDATEREPKLTELLARVKADDGLSYKRFKDAEQLAELLGDDLALLLSERFMQPAIPTPAELRMATPPVPLTGIVGREDEIAIALGLLGDPEVRLVTLTGPGGIGKTRLALEVARIVGSSSSSSPSPGLVGVSFVDLAPVRDPSAWPGAVAAALGIRPEGSRSVLHLLIDHLRGRRLLLVLDNFEQLVAAAGDLGELLAACPDLTVLLTSRIVLRLRGERAVPLAPLPIPTVDESGAFAAIRDSASVRLLVDRAQEVRPGFALTPTNAVAVAELCRRLDGIPLALELAAAQLRLLSPAALLGRLGDALDLAAGTVDVPARQRTLRATIEWSYSLLGEDERTLLARLSVFRGAWTLEASEAVGAVDGDLDVLEALSSLAAQSLIRIESDESGPRFRMLDAIRAYARERLVERDEGETTVARLAAYLVSVVSTVRDELHGPEHRSASERLDRVRDEMQSAIHGALQTDDALTVVGLLTPLFTYWWSRGLLGMTAEVAEKTAALPSAAYLEAHESARLLGTWGMAMVMTGRPTEAEPLLGEALDTATKVGDAELRAYSLLGLGWTTVSRAAVKASERLQEAAEGFRQTGDLWGLTVTLSTQGQYALLTGDDDAARRLHADALSAAKAANNDYLQAHVLDMLGLGALTAGQPSGAREYYAAAAALHAGVLDYEGSAYCLFGLASIAFAEARPRVAARLLGASGHARHVVGVAVWPGMQGPTDALVNSVGAALGQPSFAEACGQGERMRVPDALDYALAASAPDADEDPFDTFSSRLIAVS
jgi:predicted ATPase